MLLNSIVLFCLHAVVSAASLPRSPQGGPNLSLTGKTLRIQTLGDSITMGYQSTSGNGYRSTLFNHLSPSNTVTMVGSQTAGDMGQNHHEGHSGALITETFNNAMMSLNGNPNVILLHIGTNNANKPSGMSTATTDLSNLLTSLHSQTPLGTIILIAKLIPSSNSATNANINTINSQIDNIVTSLTKFNPGARIAAVDMQSVPNGGDAAHVVTTADLKDELHPNDKGYEKMGLRWYDALVKANADGWFDEGEVTINV